MTVVAGAWKVVAVVASAWKVVAVVAGACKVVAVSVTSVTSVTPALGWRWMRLVRYGFGGPLGDGPLITL